MRARRRRLFSMDVNDDDDLYWIRAVLTIKAMNTTTFVIFLGVITFAISSYNLFSLIDTQWWWSIDFFAVVHLPAYLKAGGSQYLFVVHGEIAAGHRHRE